jgi:periplasmic protein TonB
MKIIHPLVSSSLVSIGLFLVLSGCSSTATRLSTGPISTNEAAVAPPVSNLVAPVVTARVAPVYPFEMRRQGVGGVVFVECLIDERGQVKTATADNTEHESLRTAAVDAVRKWTFTPALRDGLPVAVKVSVPIGFSLY